MTLPTSNALHNRPRAPLPEFSKKINNLHVATIKEKLGILGDSRTIHKNYEIIGRIGTYHIICNISNSDIKIGNKVIINVNPKFVDSSIRREYR